MDFLENQVASILKKKSPVLSPLLSLSKLAGDASSREYYRAGMADGQTFIIMKLPAGSSSLSEEITKTSNNFNELPFVNVQKYLDVLGLPVAKIVADVSGQGILVLEDLGDISLEQKIREKNEKSLIESYADAINLLVSLQVKTALKPDEKCIAYARRFDKELLVWELNHFLEYGIEDRLKISVDPGEKKKFQEIFSQLSGEISQMPQGFVHRDFQSRNLMLKGGKMYLIDFQDALVGPLLYDLVALLRDSYVQLPDSVLKNLQNHYISKVDLKNPYHKKGNILRDDFDLITIQRKLKDAGRFQYINTVKQNPRFLQHVPHSLRYVREALQRREEYAELHNMIAKYLPELTEGHPEQSEGSR